MSWFDKVSQNFQMPNFKIFQYYGKLSEHIACFNWFRQVIEVQMLQDMNYYCSYLYSCLKERPSHDMPTLSKNSIISFDGAWISSTILQHTKKSWGPRTNRDKTKGNLEHHRLHGEVGRSDFLCLQSSLSRTWYAYTLIIPTWPIKPSGPNLGAIQRPLHEGQWHKDQSP